MTTMKTFPNIFYTESLLVTTEMVKEQLAELPLASAKMYMTVVSPTGNELPEVWVLPVRVTVPELSVAVASAKLTATDAVPT